MLNNDLTSKYFLLFIITILAAIFFLLVLLIISPGLTDGENLHPKNFNQNYQIVCAEFFDAEFFEPGDTSSSVTHKKEKSDLFYYVLGIIILIAAGFILKQRYEQYLKQRDNL